MDIWSDPNLLPFMGITAHRIDMMEVNSLAGTRTVLRLRSYLIGFHCIPGRHTGQHLARLLVSLLDRLEILPKVSDIQLRYK
jgi:hypothetical protein